MTTVRPRLHIFLLSDMLQIKRGRKSIEPMPPDEADASEAICAWPWWPPRATQPIKHLRPPPASTAVGVHLGEAGDPDSERGVRVTGWYGVIRNTCVVDATLAWWRA